MRHVGAALEMLGLVERAVILDGDVAQMDEMDAAGEFLHHGDDVVVGARAVGAGAERQPVSRAVDGIEDEARILGCRNDARQTIEREGRVVRMDAHARPFLLGHRNDLAKEPGEIVAQLLWPD